MTKFQKIVIALLTIQTIPAAIYFSVALLLMIDVGGIAEFLALFIKV